MPAPNDHCYQKRGWRSRNGDFVKLALWGGQARPPDDDAVWVEVLGGTGLVAREQAQDQGIVTHRSQFIGIDRDPRTILELSKAEGTGNFWLGDVFTAAKFLAERYSVGVLNLDMTSQIDRLGWWDGFRGGCVENFVHKTLEKRSRCVLLYNQTATRLKAKNGEKALSWSRIQGHSEIVAAFLRGLRGVKAVGYRTPTQRSDSVIQSVATVGKALSLGPSYELYKSQDRTLAMLTVRLCFEKA